MSKSLFKPDGRADLSAYSTVTLHHTQPAPPASGKTFKLLIGDTLRYPDYRTCKAGMDVRTAVIK